MEIIDLFAGCGGFSTGFEMAGFKSVLAVEKDEWAAETYKLNHKGTKVVVGDIRTLTNLNELLDKTKESPIGIIGGPPCQGFSLCGDRDRKDPRNSLFMEYVRFVNHYQPKFFVMENVKGILSMKTKSGELVKDIIIKEFTNVGYNVNIYQVNAAEFGVPQLRHRVVFIGLRKDIPFDKEELEPKGFLFDRDQVTVEEAISDLPKINASEGSEISEYTEKPKNKYQKWARKGCKVLYNHVAMNHSPRLVERFQHISIGQSAKDVDKQYGQAKVYRMNNQRPYPNKPLPTLPASYQSNFVHPYLNRNFTAREGARFQSFPDSYQFYGKRITMSWDKHLSQYQQIGNAVPPLLAKGIAEHLIKYLNERGVNLNERL